MGTLAYDADRLAQLANALGWATDALDLLRCSDPEAQPALATAAAASTALDAWRLTALDIAGCAALTDYMPIALDASELALATEYVLAQLYGWRLSTDPTGTSWAVPPAMEAAALGHLISTGQVTLDTPEQIATLQRRLDTVLADPAAKAAFAANLSGDGVAELLSVLGQRRAALVETGGGPAGVAMGIDSDALAGIASIDGIVRSIANTIIDVSAPVADAQAALAAMSPFSAALVISQLDAPDHIIRLLAEDTIARYLHPATADDWPMPWEEPSLWHLGIGDVLFPRVAATSPATANRFVVSVLGMSPDALLGTVADDRSLTSLLASATDPAAVSTHAAGEVIVPLIAYLRDPPAFPAVTSAMAGDIYLETRNALGGIVAPWFAQFSARASDWGWAKEEATDGFQFVIANDQAFDDLLATSEHWLDSLRIDPTANDPTTLYWELEELGKIVGDLGTQLKLRGAQAVVADRLVWDTFTKYLPKVLDKSASKAGLTGIPAKVAAKVVALGVAKGKDLAEEHGVFGAPQPLDEALRALDLEQDQVHAVGAYLAMGSMLEVLIDAGKLPPDTPWPPSPLSPAECPTGSYLDATDAWLQASRIDENTLFAIISARSAFMGGAQSTTTCAELGSS